MSRSNGAHVYKKQMPSGKNWVFVVTVNPEGSALSFFDWYEQIRLLRECEEEKYAGRSLDPLKLPRRFFEDCWQDTMPTYRELARKHGIPDRGQETLLEWEPPALKCACGAFTPKACNWLQGREETPPDTCVSLTRDAQTFLRNKT